MRGSSRHSHRRDSREPGTAVFHVAVGGGHPRVERRRLTVPTGAEGTQEGSPVLVAHGAVQHEVTCRIDSREQVEYIAQAQFDVLRGGIRL